VSAYWKAAFVAVWSSLPTSEKFLWRNDERPHPRIQVLKKSPPT
jgi:hypothetical protein